MWLIWCWCCPSMHTRLPLPTVSTCLPYRCTTQAKLYYCVTVAHTDDIMCHTSSSSLHLRKQQFQHCTCMAQRNAMHEVLDAQTTICLGFNLVISQDLLTIRHLNYSQPLKDNVVRLCLDKRKEQLPPLKTLINKKCLW